MDKLKLYRKRIIPEECVLLKDDIIIKRTDSMIVTKWVTLNPKISFHHGCSCYFLDKGYKISKFYRADGSLLYWYCDIVEYQYDQEADALTVTDLLADVIIYPTGYTRVVDLDELAYALDKGLIGEATLKTALLRLNSLLEIIYNDKFDRLQAELNTLGL